MRKKFLNVIIFGAIILCSCVAILKIKDISDSTATESVDVASTQYEINGVVFKDNPNDYDAANKFKATPGTKQQNSFVTEDNVIKQEKWTNNTGTMVMTWREDGTTDITIVSSKDYTQNN